jgi:hypothetical protein
MNVSNSLEPQSVLLKVRKALRLAPLSLLAFQLPGAIADAVLPALGLDETKATPRTLPIYVGITFLVFILSVLSTAATFALLQQIERGETPRLTGALQNLVLHLKPLIFASLLIGLLLGICMLDPWLIIPGLVFWTLYLFVPMLILSEGPLPLMTYFNRSTKLARAHFGKTFAIVLILFAITLGTIILDRAIEGWRERAFPDLPLLAAGLKGLFSLSIETLSTVWVCYFFLKLLNKR